MVVEVFHPDFTHYDSKTSNEEQFFRWRNTLFWLKRMDRQVGADSKATVSQITLFATV